MPLSHSLAGREPQVVGHCSRDRRVFKDWQIRQCLDRFLIPIINAMPQEVAFVPGSSKCVTLALLIAATKLPTTLAVGK
jgi:hypothetical protein